MTSTSTSPTGTGAPSLPATLRLGAVDLTVSDLDQSIDFYVESLGLTVQRRSDGVAALGAGGEALIVLHEHPGAQRAGRQAGIYHLALVHSTRQELAHTALRLAATRTAIRGASDHGTHEAIYLPDPDGNEIELYWDRARDQWPDLSTGYAGGPAALDLAGLVRLVIEEQPKRQVDPGLTMGHMHLHVGDMEQGIAFYRDVLGFELQTRMPTVAFVSAGGYHHHVAFNVWRGTGVPPTPEGTVGLRHWTVVLAGTDELAAVRERVAAAGIAIEERADGFVVRDPWQIAVLFSASAPGA
jgi:catechol 2,3-dioxygenase